MPILTRRSVIRSSVGFAAAGVLSRPYIANAQAKTAEVWFAQGFAEEEDPALKNLVADYAALGLMKEAKAEIDRAHKLGLGGSTDYAGVDLVTYFLLGQQDEVQKILGQVAGRPDEFLVIQALAGSFNPGFERSDAAANRSPAADREPNA